MKRRDRATDAAELEIEKDADRRRPASHDVIDEQVRINRHEDLPYGNYASAFPDPFFAPKQAERIFYGTPHASGLSPTRTIP
jgi:hypothetical protein